MESSYTDALFTAPTECEIDILTVEQEPTTETLAILDQIETFDEYIHCCGRW